MKLVITGLSGYIGESLGKNALNRGHAVIAASRSAPLNKAFTWMKYNLDCQVPLELPAGTNAIIHLAANTSSISNLDYESEVLAARALIAASHQVKAKIIFVSSQTARPDAPTEYGRTKWLIEQEILSSGGLVVRPGLVYGGNEKGLFGSLVGLVKKFPLLPLFLPAARVQSIHVDDLAEGMLRIIERNRQPGIIHLASPEAISFSRFLSTIAKYRVRKKRWFLPVPVVLIKMIGWILGSRLRVQIGIDRLTSLFELPLMDATEDLMQLGLSLRPLTEGMHPSGSRRRRCLLQEGYALLSYLLKKPPTSSLLRRYVRAVQSLAGDVPIDLPKLFLRVPSLLALLDGFEFASKRQEAEFLWRLDAATVLAEATTYGAYRFLGIGQKSGMFINFLWISRAVICEIFWRILRTLSSPILRRFLLQSKASNDSRF